MVVSEGEAVVVDLQRDVNIYLEAAAEHGVTVRHIFETHLHTDFVSGHTELAAITGARIYVGASADAKFAHVGLRDGSLLNRAGFQNVVKVTRGFDAWLTAKPPIETARIVEA
jgi:hydroxyacylglutathione hydrolase